ncbi:MAG: PAS domain S-box protein [Verrucomicrobiota bacterium]
MYELPAIAVEDCSDEIAALVRQLHETQQRLQELAGGEVDAVIHPGGHSYMLHEAQENLRRSEVTQRNLAATQSSILNALPARIALLDQEGTILTVNDRWQNFAGGNAIGGSDSIVGQNYVEICVGARGEGAGDAHEAAAGIRAVLSGAAAGFLLDYRSHSATEHHWFRLRVNALGDVEPRGAVLMHIDITESKLAEEAAQASAATMAAAQQIGHFGSWEIELAGVGETEEETFYWSDEMFRIAGYEPGAVEVTNQFFYSRVPPEEHEHIRQAMAAAVRDHQPYTMVHQIIRPDGTACLVQESAQIFYDAKTDRPLKIIGTAHDITERMAVKNALARERNLLRLLIDNLPACIYVKDRRGRIMVFNRASVRQMGLNGEAEAMGKTVFDFFPPEIARLYEADDNQVCCGQTIKDREEPTQDHKGNPLWYLTTKLPLRDAGGVFGVLGISQDITERRKTEAALRESEVRLRFLHSLSEATRPLADPVQIMAVVARMLGEHLRVSRCAYANVEKDGEKFTILHDYTDGCASTVGQYQLSLFGEQAVLTLHNGQTLIIRDVEAEMLSKGGAHMFKSIGIKAIITCPLVKDGGLRAMMAVHQTAPRDWQAGEVSLVEEVVERCWAMIERRTAMENLRQSEALLGIASRTARLGGWAVDLPATRIDWSDEVCAIHEVLPGTVPNLEQAIGFYAPQSRERLSKAFAACADQGTPFDLELEIITAKGRPTWVRTIGEAHRDDSGAIIRVQGAFQDIAIRKQSERRIAEQAALIDEARDAIVVRDLDHRITFWSKGAERLYGWTVNEVLGDFLPRLLHVADGKFKEANRVVRESGAWNGEIEKTARDGAVLTLDCRWTLVQDTCGQPQSILSIDTDVTERKKIEQQFLRAQRIESIGTLAGGIAHDLNNALTPIILAVDLLKMKFTDQASQDLLSVLDISARRAADMVGQVLSFARGVESQQMEVEVKHLLRDIEKIANETFLKHIEVQTIIPDNLWKVLGDPTQLHQVLLNLCVNARDAMSDGGTLILSAQSITFDTHYAELNLDAKPGPYVFLQVEDNGTGIPPGAVEKIFDPFFTTKEIGKGTGLGLSTSLSIIKNHGGFMRVQSKVGKGTIFQIYLPAQAEPSVSISAETIAEIPRGNGELILIVDDEIPVRELTQQTLKEFGYCTLFASDGAEAVAIYALEREKIAVVLMDMMMPIMDGPTTVRVLQRINPVVRIIGASGLATDCSCLKYFLPKPYTAKILLETLQQILIEE